jgi:hypothetical protein
MIAPTFRKQYGDANATTAVKRCSDRPTGITRGRDENGQRARIVRALERTLHERSQKASAYVFERRGRAVEQLEHGELAACRDQRLQRQREIERIAANGAEIRLETGADEERREHLGRDFGQRLAADRFWVAARQLIGNEQTAVRGKASHHRIDEPRFLTAPRAEVAHSD